MPNVGPATAGDLEKLGIRTIEDLRSADPEKLYIRLEKMNGKQDICVLDVFRAIVDYANTGVPRMWWEYSRERKLNTR